MGMKIGLIKTISLPLGIALGLICSRRVYPILVPYWKETWWIRLILFILVTLLVSFLVISLGRVLSKILHAIFFGWLDSLLGGIFGLITSFIICGLLLHLSLFFFPGTKPFIVNSNLARRVLTFWLALPFPKPSPPDLKPKSQERKIIIQKPGASTIEWLEV